MAQARSETPFIPFPVQPIFPPPRTWDSSLTLGSPKNNRAITTRIRSGDFPPDPDGDFGPNGAFRTGTHITLCPQFFDLKPLGEIAPITTGVRIDDRINRGMVILHELMHAYSRGIRGEGYTHGNNLTRSSPFLGADKTYY